MLGRALGVGILVALASPYLAYAVQGWFTRYAADDFCTAGQVASAGFFGAQSVLYAAWSGRFGATFFITLAELVGPLAARALPGLTLVAWVGAATWTIHQLAGATGWQLTGCASLVMAMVVVYATLQTTADLPQVLDWQTGLITYLLPLVLLTLLVGQIARGARGGGTGGWTRIAACALLACVAGGSSETYAAAQVTAFGLACLLCWLIGAGSGRRYVQAMLVAALAGAGLALAAIAVAPGTGERLGQSAGIGFGLAIARALQFTPGWLRLTFARPHAIELALLVGSVGVIALGTPRQSSGARLSWAPLASGGAALALVLLACMAPAFSALGSDPPGRAQLIPQYVLVCGLALLAWLAGASAGDRGLVLVRQAAVRWSTGLGLVALLSLGPLATTARVARQLGTDRAYAAASDAVEDRIRAERANGRLDVSVPRLESTGVVKNLEFVGPDREDWFNACVARYYGVRSIASE